MVYTKDKIQAVMPHLLTSDRLVRPLCFRTILSGKTPTLFLPKSGDQSRYDPPVAKSTGRKIGASNPYHGKDTILGIRYHIQSHVKILQNQITIVAKENHRKGTLKKIFRLVPQKMNDIFAPGIR